MDSVGLFLERELERQGEATIEGRSVLSPPGLEFLNVYFMSLIKTI